MLAQVAVLAQAHQASLSFLEEQAQQSPNAT